MKKILDYLLHQRAITEEQRESIYNLYEDITASGQKISLIDFLSKNRIVSKIQLQLAIRELAIDELETSQIFLTISKDDVIYLIDNSVIEFFPPNKNIYFQEENPDHVYFILDGTVSISYKTKSNCNDIVSEYENMLEEDIVYLSTGQLFGELSVILYSNRIFNAKSMTFTYVLKIKSEYFLSLINKKEYIKNKIIISWKNYLIKGWINTQLLHNKYYQTLSSTRENIPCLPIYGKSRISKKFNKEVTEFIKDYDFFVISGEPGTLKFSLAIHMSEQIIQDGSPVIVFEKTLDLSFIDSSQHANIINFFQEEIKYLVALFGYMSPDSSTTLFKGFIRIANNGILIIKNVEYLKPKVQKELAKYLKTKFFSPIGSDKPMYSNTKVILICEDELNLDPSLYYIVKNRILRIPSLRQRKKDIPHMIYKIVHHLNLDMGKNVIEIDETVLKELVLYPWPGHYRELYDVVKRAMLLCTSNILTKEELFIGEQTPYESSQINLFNISQIKNFFKSPLFPKIGQLFGSIFLVITILFGLLGPKAEKENITPILIWADWEPLLIISIIFVARMWCAICPIRYISSFFNKVGLNREISSKYQTLARIISSLLLLSIFFFEVLFSMEHNPYYTSIFLLTILSLAVATTMIFDVNTWCKYVCPLGNMVGTFSRVSVIELRSNRNFCGVGCVTFECTKKTLYSEPCPLSKGPFNITTNHNCILCGNCVKACPYETIQLNLRPPAIELKFIKEHNFVLNIFIFVLFTTQLFRIIHSVLKKQAYWLNNITHDLSLLVVSIVITSMITLLGCLLLGLLNRKNTDKKTFDFFYLNTFLPIVYSIEFAIRIFPLFYYAPRLFEVLSNLIKHHIPHLKFMLDPQSIFVLQVISLLLGFFISIYVLNQYVKENKITKPVYYGVNMLNLTVIVSIAFLFFYSLPNISL